jgi:hypothetical protein
MNEETIINYVQQQIMDSWREVMKYEDQLRDIGNDDIIQACIDGAKERIEIYTAILEKYEANN